MNKSMVHIFNTEDAVNYGINAAVVLQNIRFWCEKNRANETHFHDGKYWTFNSVKAWAELFPYLTEKQIRTALKVLEDAGEIVSGEYNKSSYDRTKWYSTCDSGKLDLTHRANGLDPQGEPIPYINTDVNSDKENDILNSNSLNKKTTTHTGGFFPEDFEAMSFLLKGQAKDRAHLFLLGKFPKLNNIGYTNLLKDFHLYALAARKPWIDEANASSYFINWASLRKWEDIKQPAERVVFEPMKER